MKVLSYLLLNVFVLINTLYVLNIIISLCIFILLYAIGFVRYKKNLFKLLFISLSLFFLISLFLQLFQTKVDLTDFDKLIKAFLLIFGFFSKWLLINLSGLLLFTVLSQEEVISSFLKINLDFRIVISITIAFNLISRLIETLEEINISLKSRGVQGKNLFVLFKKVKYIFISMLLDNIEYISSLRATYAFDYIEIKEKYGK